MSREFKGIDITISIPYDFIMSLVRLAIKYVDVEEVLTEYNYTPDPENERWAQETRKRMDEEQLAKLNVYFAQSGNLAMGLLRYIHQLEKKGEVDIGFFLKELGELDPYKFLCYLLEGSYNREGDMTPELLKEIIQGSRSYQFIENNLIVKEKENKWDVLQMMNEPTRAQKELLELLQSYYKDIYRHEEKRVKNFLTEYCQENKDKLKKAAIKGIEHFFAPGEGLIDYKQKLKVPIVYFGEISDYAFFEDNLYVLGYKYPEMRERMMDGEEGVEEHSNIFKALGDKTRLKMLLELSQGPKYMTELGEKLEISTPTVNYHIKKFIRAGLVQIDKAENRIYYKLRKDRLKEAIKMLENNFEI